MAQHPGRTRRGSATIVALTLSVSAACERDPSLSESPPRVTFHDAGPAPSTSAPAVASAVAKVIGSLRERSLDIGTRELPAESIALGGDRFIHLGAKELSIRDLRKGKTLVTVPVQEPRRVLSLRDGTTLALCAGKTLLLSKRKHELSELRRIPLFTQSVVIPDLHVERRFWVVHAFDAALYGYEINDDGSLEILEPRQVADYDRRLFAPLKDGSFLHTTKEGIARIFLGGRRQNAKLDTANVFRLLPAQRLDRVWIGRQDGRVELVQQPGAPAKTFTTLDLPGVFDLASSARGLAALVVEQQGAKRSFSVRRYAEDGRLLWQDSLPFELDAPTGDDWVARVARNRGITVSPDGGWVAVGGPDAAVVWDKQGKRVLQE